MTTPTTTPAAGEQLITLAAQIARAGHRGQLDKAGEDYIDHPRRVADRLHRSGERAEVIAAGWLHDVLEDSPLTAEDLTRQGVPARTIELVEVMTRLPGEEYTAYLRRVAADAEALQIKRADMADNTDPARMAALDESTRVRLRDKYAQAEEILQSVQSADR